VDGARGREVMNVSRILVGNAILKCPFGRYRSRRKDII
jgi:hypothetical protein